MIILSTEIFGYKENPKQNLPPFINNAFLPASLLFFILVNPLKYLLLKMIDTKIFREIKIKALPVCFSVILVILQTYISLRCHFIVVYL